MDWLRFNPRPPTPEELAEDEDIFAEQDRRRAEKLVFAEAVWTAFDAEGILSIPTRDPTWTHVTLTHSTYPGVEYQVTRWDAEGPVGHMDGTSRKSAINELWYYVGGLDWRDRWARRMRV